VLDLRLDQKIDGASGCLLMHALRRGSGYLHGSLRAPHAVLLGCTQSSVDEFRSQDFGLLNWEAPMGSRLGVFYSVSEWNADKTHVDKVRYWTVARLFRGLCRSESMEEAGSMEAGSGHEDSITTY
jgi:hypothetical protein